MSTRHTPTRSKPQDSLGKASGSDNECEIDYPNLTQTHFRRGVLEGLTDEERTAIEAKFTAKVNKSSACWIWAGAIDTYGYGAFCLKRDGAWAQYRAHRVAYELWRESIPADLSVCHHCDIRACVNPAHLFLGTQGDNLRDAAQKDRLSVPRRRALTLEQRLEILAAPRDRATGKALAAKFGVSKSVICQVRAGRFIGSGVEHTHPALKPHRAQQLPNPLDAVFERVSFRELPIRGEVA